MLSDAVTHHIELRRALGFKYRVPATLLRSYARFAQGCGDQVVRTRTVIEWALQAPSSAQRRNRLLTVRRFARELHAEDPRHQVPPADAVGRGRYQRRRPHILTPDEVTALLHAAAMLSPQGTLRPITYAALFALMASTGLRSSEALALTVDDLIDDGLLVRETKFRKSRLVVLHESVRDALQRYIVHPLRPVSAARSLFIGLNGVPLKYSTVIAVFLGVSRSCGLRGAAGEAGVRLHDLRHTFAVRALERSAQYPGGITQHLSALSTYLGHAHVADTYWYLHATPALLSNVASQTEELHLGRRT